MCSLSPSTQLPLRRTRITKCWPLPAGLALLQLAACGDEVQVQLLSLNDPVDDTSSDDDSSGDGSRDASPSEPVGTAAPITPPFTPTATATASPDDAAGAPATTPTSIDAGAPSASPETDAVPVAVPALAVLRHHYDFAGEGDRVADRVGAADGVIFGGGLLGGTGSLALDGVDDYVDLPNGIISRYPAVSVAVWLEWHGGDCWQRIFDFGNTPDGEDNATRALTSFLLSPGSCDASHVGPVPVGPWNVSAMFHVRGSAYVLQGETGIGVGERTHLVLSAAPDSGLVLYQNGEFESQLQAPLDVSSIEDENNWLGRSQWVQDDMLLATLFDVRIYEGALDAQQVAELYRTTGQE